MPLSPEDVQSLIAAFEASEWDEMTLAVAGTRLEITRTGRPPTGAVAPTPSVGAPPVPSAPAAADGGAPPLPASTGAPAQARSAAGRAETAGGLPITAPSVGLFWRSPQPGAPPFVDVGQTVGPDDTVCIVEVMKLMNHVKAGLTGVVRSVAAENGAMVEHGQVLFVLDPVS